MIDEENNTLPSTQDEHQASSSKLLLLSLFSTTAYLILAILIFRYFHDQNLYTVFEHGYPVTTQLLIGIVSGGAAAGIIGFFINRPPVSEVLHDFYIVDMVSKLQFTSFDRIQLSAFAGVGEELLFRGAIQPLLGIWITSFIFIGIHGYFKFKSAGHMLFGLTMFGLSMLLGYLFEYTGLIAAMTAHAVYDVIMLQIVQGEDKS
ncbi:CPBP family intramembrane glutamic endopeptidase [Fodinibius sp.]|uniref:CPBP family intramembrane glutamic endopeptidase n=1 Tax=Fodinibius sp. TaxID=1872440 RepID=UPI002ACE3A7E|nr:CPBP family intramembrane glutamic endopeptidase [Fodinibius sp.]MDZ7658777.1 CPBP family intramembrane glutamic endopeptidase [Fodinibius sp.]